MVPPISKPTRYETVALSEEAQPTLRPLTGFEPVRLETPLIPKDAWFHCTTAAYPESFALTLRIIHHLLEEAQSTLGPWTGFEPVRLETLGSQSTQGFTVPRR
ncbi:hypothetical protein E2C01_043203 [Portunus trituberculatus]|uniref:Uncharacterized protein n=1 Tax=Portunus trituberculatus TaxID=210409 RepID=A0A5B7FYX1_PORTR|nr:hypothetical protein [Portunus trituberculatus]